MKNSKTSLLCLLSLFTYFFIINWMSPIFADDYSYSFSWETGKMIDGLYDIIQSQYKHWLIWGGRSVAHSLAQLFLYLGKDVFNFFNAFIFIIMLLLLYWIYRGEKPNLNLRLKDLFLIFFFVWFSTKVFGETIFWLIGACNYLWMMVFILLFLYPYKLNYDDQYPVQDTLPFCISMFIGGIIAGWTNENTALIMIAIVGSALIYFYKTNKIKKWMIVGLIGALLGYCIMICAPGNYIRTEHFENNIGILKNTTRTLIVMWRIISLQAVMWIIIGCIMIRLYKTKLYFWAKKDFFCAILFLFASLGTNFVMIGSPIFPYRATFGSTIYLSVAVMILIKIAGENNLYTKVKEHQKKILLVMGISLLTSMTYTGYYYFHLHNENLYRIKFIEDAKANNFLNLKVKEFSVQDGLIMNHVFVRDIAVNKDSWQNAAMTKYYGLESIVLGAQNKMEK